MRQNKGQSVIITNAHKSLSQDTVTRVRSQRIFEVIRGRIGLLNYTPGIALRERGLAEGIRCESYVHTCRITLNSSFFGDAQAK